MAKGNKDFFGKVGETRDGQAADAEPANRKLPAQRLAERQNRIGQILAGEIVSKALRWVEPEQCRMWERHNRRYDLLSEARCRDLIEGIKVQGGQHTPAIVRALEGEGPHKYEVICGARRHWAISWLRANHYSQYKFLVDVQNLTDEQAFRIGDSENRHRKDICDYERAVDYQKAIGLYYQSQQDMAERLEVSASWMSRLLDLARMPEEIAQAFPDITELRVIHAMKLKPYYGNPKTRDKLLAAALDIQAEQAALREAGAKPLDSAQVMAKLARSAKKPAAVASRVLGTFNADHSGDPLITVTRDGRHHVGFKINLRSGASQDEILAKCREAILAHVPAEE